MRTARQASGTSKLRESPCDRPLSRRDGAGLRCRRPVTHAHEARHAFEAARSLLRLPGRGAGCRSSRCCRWREVSTVLLVRSSRNTRLTMVTSTARQWPPTRGAAARFGSARLYTSATAGLATSRTPTTRSRSASRPPSAYFGYHSPAPRPRTRAPCRVRVRLARRSRLALRPGARCAWTNSPAAAAVLPVPLADLGRSTHPPRQPVAAGHAARRHRPGAPFQAHHGRRPGPPPASSSTAGATPLRRVLRRSRCSTSRATPPQ